MGRYTVELRELMRNEGAAAHVMKALSTYPLYGEKEKLDERYELIPKRSELNKKIIDHYRYREIGFETPGRFFEELEYTMCEMMPTYNELFKTVVTMADLPNPFDNVDFVEEYEETRTGKSNTTSSGSNTETGSSEQHETRTGETSESGTNTDKVVTNGNTTGQSTTAEDTENSRESTNNTKNVMSDTPQGQLAINNIDGVNYASEVTWNKSTESGEETTKNTSTTTSTNTNEQTVTNTGSTSKNGTTSDSVESSGTTTTSGETSSSGEQTTEGTVQHRFTKKGNQGVNTYAHDMNEFRTSIMDVVEKIINDERLNNLFMLVY